MRTHDRANADKNVARVVGVLFLVTTAAYVLGTSRIDPILNAPDYLAHLYPGKVQITIGVLLQFVNDAAAVGIGVLLFPVVKRYSETIAIGYVGTRILECALLVVGGIATLSLVALSRAAIEAGTTDASSALALGAVLVQGRSMAYQVAMCALSLRSLPFCYALYRSRLIPGPLSILGLVGYAALLVGSVLEIFGLDLSYLHTLPGGAFEFIVPIWLIAKGFSPVAVVAERAAPAVHEREAPGVARA